MHTVSNVVKGIRSSKLPSSHPEGSVSASQWSNPASYGAAVCVCMFRCHFVCVCFGWHAKEPLLSGYQVRFGYGARRLICFCSWLIGKWGGFEYLTTHYLGHLYNMAAQFFFLVYFPAFFRQKKRNDLVQDNCNAA